MTSVLGSGLGGLPLAAFGDSKSALDTWFQAGPSALDAALTIAENNITVNIGGSPVLVFDPAGAVTDGMTDIDAAFAETLVAECNQRLDDGLITISTDLDSIAGASPGYFDGDVVSGLFGTLDPEITCKVRWYGVKVHINKDAVEIIVDSLNTGATAAGLLAVLEGAGIITAPKAVLTAIIAAVAAFDAAVLSLLEVCNGVNLRIWWNGMVWPWSA